MLRNHIHALVLCGALLVAACRGDGGREAEGAKALGAIRVTDDLGRVVSLEAPAKRIAALSPAFVESLFAIGCGGAVAVRDALADYPAPAVDAIPAVDGVQLSARNVAGFEPDLVLLFDDDGRRAEELERVRIPVAVLHPGTYDEVVSDIEKLGLLCGRGDTARAVADAMRAAREGVSRGVDPSSRPTVYVEIDATDPTRPWTAGEGSFIDELVAIAGGRNALTGLPSSYAQVSAEAVIRAQPDRILLAHVGIGEGGGASEIARRPGWAELPAAAPARVIADIDGDLLSRPGPRLAEGLRALAAALGRPDGRDGGAL